MVVGVVCRNASDDVFRIDFGEPGEAERDRSCRDRVPTCPNVTPSVLPISLPHISSPAADACAFVNGKAGHRRSAALRKGPLAALSPSSGEQNANFRRHLMITTCSGPRGSGSTRRDRPSRADDITPAVRSGREKRA